jgi:hypothetical protein
VVALFDFAEPRPDGAALSHREGDPGAAEDRPVDARDQRQGDQDRHQETPATARQDGCHPGPDFAGGGDTVQAEHRKEAGAQKEIERRDGQCPAEQCAGNVAVRLHHLTRDVDDVDPAGIGEVDRHVGHDPVAKSASACARQGGRVGRDRNAREDRPQREQREAGDRDHGQHRLGARRRCRTQGVEQRQADDENHGGQFGARDRTSPWQHHERRGDIDAEQDRKLIGAQSHRHGGDRAAEDRREQHPAAGEGDRGAVGLVLEDVVAAGPRQHGAEFGAGHRAGQRNQSAEQPDEKKVPDACAVLGDDRRRQEDADADHRSRHDREGVEGADHALRAGILAGGVVHERAREPVKGSTLAVSLQSPNALRGAVP